MLRISFKLEATVLDAFSRSIALSCVRLMVERKHYLQRDETLLSGLYVGYNEASDTVSYQEGL